MKMKLIPFVCLLLLEIPVLLIGQDVPSMIYIPEGTAMLGGGYQFEYQDWRMHYLGFDPGFDRLNAKSVAIGEVPESNNSIRQVSVASFLLSDAEISNKLYRDFLIDSLLKGQERVEYDLIQKKSRKAKTPSRADLDMLYSRAIESGLCQDTMAWQNDFEYAFNKPLTDNYHWHPAFDDYPVVGVSWEQANAYCKWLSNNVNSERAKKGKSALPNYRLPTEMEFEYAARAMVMKDKKEFRNFPYPWRDEDLLNDKGKYRANLKTDHGQYLQDDYTYTAPIRSFLSNGFGLYDMAGNVAEWVLRINVSSPVQPKGPVK